MLHRGPHARVDSPTSTSNAGMQEATAGPRQSHVVCTALLRKDRGFDLGCAAQEEWRTGEDRVEVGRKLRFAIAEMARHGRHGCARWQLPDCVV